jgi:hypothetical protein
MGQVEVHVPHFHHPCPDSQSNQNTPRALQHIFVGAAGGSWLHRESNEAHAFARNRDHPREGQSYRREGVCIFHLGAPEGSGSRGLSGPSLFPGEPGTVPWGDLEIAAAASSIVRSVSEFAFVYLGNVDMAGHDHGFMSRDYLETLQTADAGGGMILNALNESGLAEHYNVVLQSDHEGVDRSHHDPLPEVVTMPWLAYGPGVRAGVAFTSPVSVLDTAPTPARLLNMSGHETWQGRVIEELFMTGPRRVDGLG